MSEVTKVCGGCGVEKPLSDFYKAPANQDGYNNRCKDCLRAYRAKYIERKKRGESSTYTPRFNTGRKEKDIESLKESYDFWNKLLLAGNKNACV